MKSRIKLLEEYVSPAYFAYLDRVDGNRLTNHEFKRVGGGRELVYAEWDTYIIDSMEENEFQSILNYLEIRKIFFEKYSHLTLFEFLNMIDNEKNKRTDSK